MSPPLRGFYVHRLSIDAPMTPMLGTIPMTPMLGTILWIRPLISLRSTIGASVASPIMCACESELQIGTWPSCELQIGSSSCMFCGAIKMPRCCKQQ